MAVKKPVKTRIDGPWYPVEYELGDAAAIQALMRGEANADQQRRAMKWIIEKACGTYEEVYYPHSETDTAYACGSRFVGQQIVKMSKLILSKLRTDRTQESEDG